MDKTTGM